MAGRAEVGSSPNCLTPRVAPIISRMTDHDVLCGLKTPGALASGTVVIVDDNKVFRESLQILLETMGFEARCFANGGDMLRSDDLPEVACFLLDYHLPDGTGLDVMAALNSRTPNPRMVLISGNAGPAVKQRAHDQGAIAALDKPIDDARLSAILATAFSA